MKRVAVLSVLLGACSPATPVGFFDMQRVVSESREAVALLEAANKAAEPARVDAQRARDVLGRLTAVETGFDQKKAMADKALDTFQETLKRERAAAGAKLDERLAVITAKLATSRKMQIVFGVPGRPTYAVPGLDLTADVIAALDGTTNELAAARARVKELEAAARADGGVRHVPAGRVP